MRVFTVHLRRQTGTPPASGAASRAPASDGLDPARGAWWSPPIKLGTGTPRPAGRNLGEGWGPRGVPGERPRTISNGGHPRGPRGPRDVRLVKEGFSWPAFLFTFLWALWHRMWWTALGLLVISWGAALAVEALLPGHVAGPAVLLALYVAIGYLGNDLLRRHLEASGFAEAGVTCGKDRDEALYRFLDADPALARDLVGSRA